MLPQAWLEMFVLLFRLETWKLCTNGNFSPWLQNRLYLPHCSCIKERFASSCSWYSLSSWMNFIAFSSECKVKEKLTSTEMDMLRFSYNWHYIQRIKSIITWLKLDMQIPKWMWAFKWLAPWFLYYEGKYTE